MAACVILVRDITNTPSHLARSSASFSKREKEKKRQQKQQEKQARKEERKANASGGGLDNMLAYVDENGMITDTPPDPSKRQEIAAEEIELGVPKREEIEESPFKSGRIDFFDTSKGFGFINEDGTQERYFVHISGMIDEAGQNDKVTFEVERGPKGLNAVRVKKA